MIVDEILKDLEGKEVFDLTTVMPGAVVEVQTRNSTYLLKRDEEGSWTIEGNEKYCPTPTECAVNGSTWGGSCLLCDKLGVGMHMEFCLHSGPYDGKRTVTSPIKAVKYVDA